MTADTFCCLYEVSVAEENFYFFFVSFYSHVFDVMVGQKQIFHHVFFKSSNTQYFFNTGEDSHGSYCDEKIWGFFARN